MQLLQASSTTLSFMILISCSAVTQFGLVY